MKISNPHDILFKKFISTKRNAISFVKTFLPSEVKSIIDFSSIEFSKESYVTDQLLESFSDVILSFKLNDIDQEVFISILIEHKSYKDKYASFQILSYLAQGYQQQIKNKEDIKIIIPMLFYHGQETWEYQNTNDLYTGPEALKKYFPKFDTPQNIFYLTLLQALF